MAEPQDPTRPSLRDFNYFDDRARPVTELDKAADLPDTLEDQILLWRSRRSRQLRGLFFASIFFLVAFWFLWGYRDLITYTLSASEEPLRLGDVTQIEPGQIPHNTYVRLSGITEHRGLQQKVVRGLDFSRAEFWYFGLLGSRGVFIEVAPDPDKYGLVTEVTVTGRAVDPTRETQYQQLLQRYRDMFFPRERPHVRIIQVGLRPGDGQGGLVAVVGFFLLITAINVWTIVRFLRFVRQKPAGMLVGG